MVIAILTFIKQAWNKWNITGFVLLSLLLQIFFSFYCIPKKENRKQMGNGYLVSLSTCRLGC